MFKTILLILFSLGSLFEILMIYLNYQSRNNEIPECVKDVYDQETYLKWRDYNAENSKIKLFFVLINWLVYFVLLYTNVFSKLSNLISDNLFLKVLLVMGTTVIVDTIISTIQSYFVNFKIEAKYGFNKMTTKTFVSDTIKDFILNFILMNGLVFVFGLLYNKLGDYVVLVFTGICIVFVLFIIIFYPKFTKIYNKFTPLEEGSLRNKLTNLLESHEYHVKEINVMDASKRTTKSNAYFAGTGKTKTIVLYDTLISNMTEDEIVAVFAHELGHGLHKDTIKNNFISYFNIAIMVCLAWLLLKIPQLYTDFGFKNVDYGFLMIALSYGLLPFVNPLMGMLSNFIIRKAEYRADKQAVKEGYGNELISALKKLSRENFSNLNPNKVVVKLTYNHPTLVQRIEAIQEELNK